MVGGLRRVAAFVLFAFALLAPLPSHAFCGFYVNTGETPLYNEATRVAMLRAGTRTVLSIQNDYSGPLDDFALVIPVPIILERENVRTLPHTLFDRVDRLTSPRLVEYWEQDPCEYARYEESADNKEGGTGTRAKGEEGSMGNPNKPLVVVEREFKVDEYDIVILSALDSGALETWLHQNNYKIPKGAEPYFRPYVQDGSKFFVAKVDIKRVKMRWSRAQLSPLRFHYDTPEFKLPIRLGLINSNGQQDLLVYILGAERYETANYENLFIPTNLQLTEEARTKFHKFYAALFDKTLVDHNRAVVTEYSWSPESCDPCPEGAGPLAEEDARLLGADVIKPMPPQMVLTRLHARYGKDSVGDDLVFKTASPVVGGRDGTSHEPEPSSQNNFQARYIMRHYWTGPVTCTDPRFGTWGGPEGGNYKPPPKANPLSSRDLAVEDFIVDEKTASPHAGQKGPVLKGRATERGGHRLVIFAGLLHALNPAHWFGRDRERAFFIAWGGSFVVALILAWRRRVGVIKTLGLFVLFGTLALAVAANAMSFRHYLVSDFSLRYFGREGLLFIATAVMVAGAAVGRTNLRVGWAFLPVLAGLVRALEEKAQLYDAIHDDETIALSQLSRIYAESTAEAFQPILIGAAITGFFLVMLTLIGPGQKREGLKWGYAIGAFALAALARNVLVEQNGIDIIAMVVFAGAAVAIVRANGSSAALAAVTGVLLLDIASKLFVTSRGLYAISSESIDPFQLSTILTETLRFEGRHLVLTAIDLGIAVGLMVLTKVPFGFVDWRTLTGATALLVITATPFEWYGSRNDLASLDPVHGGNVTLQGPTLFALGSALTATPGQDVAAQPYSPAVAEKMARAESGSSPLLIARGRDPFASLLSALAPLTQARQYDYRLLETSEAPPQLGVYGNLIAVRDAEAMLVDIMPKLDEPALRATNYPILALRMDGEQVTVRVLGSGSKPKTLPLRDTAGSAELRGLRSDFYYSRLREGTLAVPSETSLAKIGELLSWFREFKVVRVTLSPDVTVLDKL